MACSDCFHPSLAAHQRLARGVWNRLTRSREEKEKAIDWDGDGVRVRCLQDGDRIRLGRL
jgi:phospholipase B1